MKPILLLTPFLIALSGCATAPSEAGAWKSEDFAHASKPETEEIAAVCLREYFSGYQAYRVSRVYYLGVKDADWRAVVARAKITEPKALFRGSQDHFWSDSGYRDKETGLQAYFIGIDTQRITGASAEVFMSWSAGTNLGFSSVTYRLEKKEDGWKVMEKIQGPTA